MKTSIHPQWFDDALVTCACGNTFKVGATKPELKVEICAKCHPFFTGEMKFNDTMGLVEKFQQKQKAASLQSEKLAEKKKKKVEREDRIAKAPRSLKEMLIGMK